jgi:hypothetical protein
VHRRDSVDPLIKGKAFSDAAEEHRGKRAGVAVFDDGLQFLASISKSMHVFPDFMFDISNSPSRFRCSAGDRFCSPVERAGSLLSRCALGTT